MRIALRDSEPLARGCDHRVAFGESPTTRGFSCTQKVGQAGGVVATFDTKSFYRRYIACCNEHRFDALSDFVHHDVVVNDGAQCGLHNYVEGLETVVRGFPDYHWELRHLLIDGSSIVAHFRDTGTHRGPFLGMAPTGRRVSTQEFALYHLRGGKIAEAWVTADNLQVLDQLR